MRRHDRVFLRPGAYFEFYGGCAVDKVQHAAVAAWIAAGRGLVRARQRKDCSSLVLLGIRLPIAAGGQKLTLGVDSADILNVLPPLSLSKCLSYKDELNRHLLLRLEQKIAQVGGRLGIFGSLSWENMSGGESYRHSDSDIDLICDIETTDQISAALLALEDAAVRLSCRLDGEIRLISGSAVSWRELTNCRHNFSKQLLIKGEQSVWLSTVGDFMNGEC